MLPAELVDVRLVLGDDAATTCSGATDPCRCESAEALALLPSAMFKAGPAPLVVLVRSPSSSTSTHGAVGERWAL